METIGERLKAIRKHLQLTQTDFGKRIALSQGHLTAMEHNRREVTDRTMKLLFQEFSVNETWLRTGEGEMFVPTSSEPLDVLAKEFSLTDDERLLIEVFLSFPTNRRRQILDFVHHLSAELAEKKAQTLKNSVEAKVEAYRQELLSEQEEQLALPNTVANVKMA